MAIYSLHHRPVGKSTQAQPYTAAAHIGYITRKRAMSLMQKERLPGESPQQIADHLRQCEDADRKNARVIDKIMLALPKELDQVQRVALVRDFAEQVTKGRAPWLAAFHDKGKDQHNPHCHLVIRDRDPETGKRVIGTSEVGSTERLREQWEKHANSALERAGRPERVDRRTLEAQGVDREPTIHEGPQSQAMDKRGARPKSRRRRLRNRPGSRHPHRDVDYRAIDKGKSRPQVNRMRRQGAQESERDYWDAIDRDNQDRELDSLRLLHNPNPSRMEAGRFGGDGRAAYSGMEKLMAGDKKIPKRGKGVPRSARQPERIAKPRDARRRQDFQATQLNLPEVGNKSPSQGRGVVGRKAVPADVLKANARANEAVRANNEMVSKMRKPRKAADKSYERARERMKRERAAERDFDR